MSDNTGIIDRLIKTATDKIDSKSEAEIKTDMKKVVVSLIEFVGGEDGRILDPNTPEDEIGKLFFKMIGNLVMDGMTAKVSPVHKDKLEKKFENIMSLYPLLKSYSNIE